MIDAHIFTGVANEAQKSTRFCYLCQVTFPADYPESCPPAGAWDLNGDFFRFATENVADLTEPRNYQSLFELRKRNFPPAQECKSRDLSGFLTLPDLEIARTRLGKKFPQYQTYPTVVLGLQSGDGLALKTPSSNNTEHHSFWVCVGIDIPQRRR